MDARPGHGAPVEPRKEIQSHVEGPNQLHTRSRAPLALATTLAVTARLRFSLRASAPRRCSPPSRARPSSDQSRPSRVTLILTNAQSQAKYEIRTDRNGRFEFVGLPPGDYAGKPGCPGSQTSRAPSLSRGATSSRTSPWRSGRWRKPSRSEQRPERRAHGHRAPRAPECWKRRRDPPGAERENRVARTNRWEDKSEPLASLSMYGPDIPPKSADRGTAESGDRRPHRDGRRRRGRVGGEVGTSRARHLRGRSRPALAIYVDPAELRADRSENEGDGELRGRTMSRAWAFAFPPNVDASIAAVRGRGQRRSMLVALR